MIKINVAIKGLEPGLLMHSDKGMFNPSSEKPGKGNPTKEDAEKVAYRSKNGNLFIPTTAIYGTMVNAATAWIKQGKKMTTYIVSTLDITPVEEIPLLDLNGKLIKDYEVNTRIVHNFKVGRLLVACPQIKEWQAMFEMKYNPAMFLETPTTLKHVLEQAGLYVGILAWRPQHKGRFGRFTIKKWEVKEY